MDLAVKSAIEKMISEHPVILFMKGTADNPMCGFSMRAVQILEKIGVPFQDVNILLDDDLRQGLKEFGDWPTFPQLYVNKELIGGCDIMVEMYQSGELQELFGKK